MDERKPYQSAVNGPYAKAIMEKHANQKRTPEDIIMEASMEPTDEHQPLTREQIEGEGWVFMEGLEPTFTDLSTWQTTKGGQYQRNEGVFRFTIIEGNAKIFTFPDLNILFQGRISSIHQFRTLMQMLGIK